MKVRTQSWVLNIEPEENFHVSQNRMSASNNDEFLFKNTSSVVNLFVVFH